MTKAQQAAKAAPPPRIGVRSGRLPGAKRFCFYGPEGVGKSSLAADSDNPIAIDVEDGAREIDVPRYEFRPDDPAGHVPRTLEEIWDCLHALEVGDHDYRTLSIDTLDALEPLIWKFCCDRDAGKQSALNKSGKKLESIESYGYGKGYVVALDMWRDLAARLDRLRQRRQMNILLLGHMMIRTFKNPSDDDYDRYQMRLNVSAASFIKEWCDVVGFVAFEETTAKISDDDIRARGYMTGRRMIYTQRSAAYDAKTRISLPEEIELTPDNPWAPFKAALAENSAPPTYLIERIGLEIERIGDDDLKKKVEAAINDAEGNAATLTRYLNKLRRTEPKEG